MDDQVVATEAKSFGQEIFFIPPAEIQVLREARQRRSLPLDGLKESIAKHGIANPIIVRRDLRLVAGERRLQSAIELGLALVPCRYFESMDETEAQIIELEENLKRLDLEWQDKCRAVGVIHQLYCSRDPEWTPAETAAAIGQSASQTSKDLRLWAEIEAGNQKVLENPRKEAAYNILTRRDQRESARELEELIEANPARHQTPATPAGARPLAGAVGEPSAAPPPPVEVLNQSFLDWAPSYSGPKFNFLHCDFPYGIEFAHGEQGGKGQEGIYDDSKEVYFELLDCFVKNFENFATHSCHLIFWFSMRHYEATRQIFRNHLPSLTIIPHPLIWGKTDNSGIIGDVRRNPRHIYENALFGFRGGRTVVQSVGDFYGAPTDRALHPSAKPEPVLKHFFRLVVDDQTSLLDPTCGAGSALRAADAMGAQRVLGLEIDPIHAETARVALSNSRRLRHASSSNNK